MKAIYRNGTPCPGSKTQNRTAELLYGSLPGRMLLKLLTLPAVSRFAGALLSSPVSRIGIRPFIHANRIDLSQYTDNAYPNYNAFFTRKIRPECRPIDMDPNHLISPCDSKLSILPIAEDTCFCLKHTSYTVSSLLKNDCLAASFAGGYAMIFRLSVEDYHRYCYVCDGHAEKTVQIPGVLHTVNPIANDHVPVYQENCRHYTILHCRPFGRIVTMEVGALLVGKIVNHCQEPSAVCRGQEKGFFQFGGSTIVLLFPPDSVLPDPDLLENSRLGTETVVRLGERIGAAVHPLT